MIHFNSHTREGVTGRIWGVDMAHTNFNSHTREGVTSSVPNASITAVFQLTHP